MSLFRWREQSILSWAVLGVVLTACSAGPGNGGADADEGADSAGDGDGDLEEEELTECVGDECPGGSREGVRETCAESRSGARLLRRLTRSEFEMTLRSIFPEVSGQFAGVELSQDPVSQLGFSTDAKVLVVNGPTFKDWLETAETLADLVTEPSVLGALLPCSLGAADAACVMEWVNQYGLRIFRRPLTSEESERYVSYHQSVAARSDFASGLKWTLSVMLQSPHAVYRSETGQAEGSGYRLTPYEVATNLAYTYSGTTPSPELLGKAEAGLLSSPEALKAEADALFAPQENWNVGREFFRQWLGYDRIANQSRDDEPAFATQISHALIEETRLFLDEILFRDGTVHTLMTADFTALNGPLSEFYGFGEVSGDAFVRAARPAGHGVGVLSQGSLLAVTAHQAETSPTLRGLLFTESFLCVEPPPPPDIVPPLAEAAGIENAKTTREKYELHHGVGGCANCHKNFDPYGFTFEQFDETGRYRADEAGVPIDTVAEVTLPDGSQRTFSTLEEVSAYVHDSEDIQNCVSGLMASYYLSGGGGTNCLAEESRKQLAAGEISLREYFISLAGTPHFSSRGL